MFKPGVADDTNFEQHWSVQRWRDYSWPPPGADLTSLSGLQLVLRQISRNAAAAKVAEDATSASYWAYHVLRTSFFITQVCGAARRCMYTDVR